MMITRNFIGVVVLCLCALAACTSSKESTKTLTVLSWNVWHGGHSKTYSGKEMCIRDRVSYVQIMGEANENDRNTSQMLYLLQEDVYKRQEEMMTTTKSERTTRVIDFDQDASMEQKKRCLLYTS